MSDVNQYFSYNKVKSTSFTLVFGVAFTLLCLLIFDKGLLGVTVEFEAALKIIKQVFSDPTVYIVLIILFGNFIYRSLINKKIDKIGVMSKKLNYSFITISLLIGVGLMIYGYLDSSPKGPLWVMFSVMLIGLILIKGGAMMLFKYDSTVTNEDYRKSNFSATQVILIFIVLSFVGLCSVVIAMW